MTKNQNTLLGCFAIFILVALGCACPNENERSNSVNNSSTSGTPLPNSSNVDPDDPFKGREITWKDYTRVYSSRSNSTDMQKEALWPSFQGKIVTWTGTVVDVSDGSFGGLAINIKMEPETLTSDIRLRLREDQKEKAISLTKDKKVKFTGRLKSYGGPFLPLTIEEGELK